MKTNKAAVLRAMRKKMEGSKEDKAADKQAGGEAAASDNGADIKQFARIMARMKK